MSVMIVGDRAPGFARVDGRQGERVVYEPGDGQPTWLAFFRYASCPLCNLRIQDLSARYESLAERGLRVLTVFQSTPEQMQGYVAKQRPPFPLLSDPDESLYATYGVTASLAKYLHPLAGAGLARATARGFMMGRMDGTKTRVPADFLIDGAGVVRERFDGGHIGEHIPFERVEAFLDAQRAVREAQRTVPDEQPTGGA